MSKVSFSMNGWRRNLSEEVRSLRDTAKQLLNDEELDRDELRRVVDEIICMSNSVNCVSIEGEELFSDMSDVCVPILDEED
ncbi:hypothetical protein ACK39T_04460 [Aeromonas veronii]|uniref:hypothetical protein n=1 Tax=Aeromonas veronii TaxID=654 RepID=UPI001116FAD5|nr:hypothetical protein [Aeromonas veronii]